MILVATASPEVQARCIPDLIRFSPTLTVPDYHAMIKALLQIRPDILVLDADLADLKGVKGIAALRSLNVPTRIVILSRPLSEDAELELFKLGGVHGCCSCEISGADLRRAVAAVQAGEFWMRRSLTSRMLEELKNSALLAARNRHLPRNSMPELTQREREIAALVGRGNCNKQIARRLEISERTVKAHLTEIFRKLGISDRLSLALRIVGARESDRESMA